MVLVAGVEPWAFRPDGDLIRWRSWQGVLSDVRFTLRTLMRRPLYTVGVAGTLGLAAATVSFAVGWTVWLAPMPYPDPDRVVRLYEIAPPELRTAVSEVVTEPERHQLSATLPEDFRAHSWRTIEEVSAAIKGIQFESAWNGETYIFSGVSQSPGGFGILGIVPMLGRLLTEAEVLIAERFWRTSLGRILTSWAPN
jgi:putative ABC transport system permease protein